MPLGRTQSVGGGAVTTVGARRGRGRCCQAVGRAGRGNEAGRDKARRDKARGTTRQGAALPGDETRAAGARRGRGPRCQEVGRARRADEGSASSRSGVEGAEEAEMRG